MALEDAAESGLAPEEAARIARRDLGSFAREEARAVWSRGWDAVSGSAIHSLAHIYPTRAGQHTALPLWRGQARSFDSLAAVTSSNIRIAKRWRGGSYRRSAGDISLFDVLSVQPRWGWAFRPEEEEPGCCWRHSVSMEWWRMASRSAAASWAFALPLGARTGQVRRLVLWQGLWPVLLGLTSGMLIAPAAGFLVRPSVRSPGERWLDSGWCRAAGPVKEMH